MNRRLLVAGIIIAVVIFITIGSFITLSRIPQISDQVSQGTSSVLISLVVPQNSGAWPLDSFIPVLVSAEGDQPVQSLELYINGVLYDTKTAPQDWAGNFLATHWNWQPGSAGLFTLVAYGKDASGQTGISSPVVIIAKESTGSRTAIQTIAGDSLQGLSEKNNISLPDIQNANPGVDPAKPLEPGLQIFLPNPPAAIQDQVSIPAYVLPPPILYAGSDQSGSEEGTGGNDPQIITSVPIPPGEPQSQPGNLSSNLIDNIAFWLKIQNGTSNVELPLTPEITGDFSGCTAKIRFNAHAFADLYDIYPGGSYDYLRPKAEDGFFLYQSQDGGPWVRIATWEKIGKDSMDTIQYDDPLLFPDQYGQVSYSLSAFNPAGESPSAPVTLPFDPNNCKAPASRGMGGLGKVTMNNGNMVLPYSMDLAYFYLKVNNSRGFRVPEGGRSFLPASGVQFNIFDYLDTVVDKYPQPDLDLTMEVWGWSGGELVYVGTFKTAVHRAVLMVCSVEGEGACTGGGGGHWVTETNISPDKPIQDQVFEMRWQTTSQTEVERVCDQLATLPYPNDNYWTMNQLIYAGCRWQNAQDHEGTYPVHLAMLYPDGGKSMGEFGAGSQGKYEYDSNWFQYNYQQGAPFSLYSRFLPLYKMSGYNRISNTVAMHFNTPKEPSGLPPLASTYPSIYDVEILRDNYSAPLFEGADWGCVIVDEDPSPPPQEVCVAGICTTVGNLPHLPGDKICPTPMQHTQDCGSLDCLLGEFANSLGFLYDMVAYGISAYIQELSVGVASLIPGCSESADCVSVTHTAISYGFTALTGIPANLPSYSEFVSGNVVPAIMDEITGDPTVSALYNACSSCKKAVEDTLTSQLEQYASLQSQNACINAYDAMLRGFDPLCLDPKIKVHPAPGSGNFPGGVLVKITRRTTAESLAATEADADKYQLALTVVAKNPSITTYPEYSIYQDALVKIPWMQPGESKIVPVSLMPCYNHNQNYCGFGEAWDAIKPIFFGGSTNMLATEKCYSADSSWPWVSCVSGGRDQWEFNNPAAEGQ
jgi:LysM repeat protein